jgi:hypothetical protein
MSRVTPPAFKGSDHREISLDNGGIRLIIHFLKYL